MGGSIHYEWTSGSIPPPHYFEVRVTIAFDGSGTLECQPDYPSGNPAAWTWAFEVPSEKIPNLKSLASSALLRKKAGDAAEAVSVGGPTETITVEEGGRKTSVPTIPPLVSAIRSSVPEELWTELRGRRDRYVDRTFQESGRDGG
jgi:hypothetical protein